MKRSRGRNRRPGGNPQNAFNNPNRHYESVCPDVKIRGSAQQVLEKYLQYARDAQTSGDRILSEAYFQFAEHYQRIVARQQEARVQQQSQHPGRGGERRDEHGGRSGPDREERLGPGNEGADAGDEGGDEAVVIETLAPAPRREAERAETLRVIGSDEETQAELSDEDGDEETGDPLQGHAGGAERTGRSRRRPYRPREDRPQRAEEGAVSHAETDGVMKTLARGRRRPASEEAAPAGTTD